MYVSIVSPRFASPGGGSDSTSQRLEPGVPKQSSGRVRGRLGPMHRGVGLRSKFLFFVHNLHQLAPMNGQSCLHPLQSSGQILLQLVQIVCPVGSFGVSSVGAILWHTQPMLLLEVLPTPLLCLPPRNRFIFPFSRQGSFYLLVCVVLVELS